MLTRVCRGIVVVLVWGHAQTVHAQPTVKLSDWEYDRNGTGVRFVSLQTLTENDTNDISLPDQTADGKFQYGVTTNEVRWADDCRCFRYYIVNVRSAASGITTRHKFKAIPSGTFPDAYAQITMTIKEGDRTDSDTIPLPVGSAPSLQPPVVEVVTHKPLESVLLSGTSEVQVTLTNKGSMRVTVLKLFVVPEQNDLWQQPPAFDAAVPFDLQPQNPITLKLSATPKTGRAIGISWPPTDNNQRHTTFSVAAQYENPLFQNRSEQTSVSVPIRFQPSVLSLAAALLCGVLLGSLVLLLTKKSPWRPWLRAAVTALLVGVILELVGMFLVANASKFVLFGYNLDPWQSLPVVLLGIGVGLLGMKSAKQLESFFKS
jgi:hypothetical protein